MNFELSNEESISRNFCESFPIYGTNTAAETTVTHSLFFLHSASTDI
jgi:hypothetical protein